MKGILLSCSLFLSSAILSAAAEPVSYSSITFHSVDDLSGTNALIHFKDVIIQERLFDVSVGVDRVVICLKEDPSNYTTLDLIDVSDGLDSYKWLRAERVIVVVRSKSDFLAWEKFLSAVKVKQASERKARLEPKRVLPPKDLSP